MVFIYKGKKEEISKIIMKTSIKTFTERVRSVVRNIPKGKVMTYLEVAKKAGNAKASRAVGNIMKQNYDKDIPCHRVIRSDGRVGSYNRGGAKKKLEMLEKEKVLILNLRK
jgi:O-6-methylguanine DNA methyltransferase